MLKKVLHYSVVGMLLLALVGGTVYILARPEVAETARGGSQALDGAGTGYRGGQGSAEHVHANGASTAQTGRDGCQATDEVGTGYRGGQGTVDGTGTGYRSAQGTSAETGTGYRGGQGGAGNAGQGSASSGMYAAEPDWTVVEGTVTLVNSEMSVQTAEGVVVVGLGQAWFRDEAGFTLNVGDEVSVRGYYEDGEFKAGTLENLTTGATLTLRDEFGRPFWSGRGENRNRP